MPTLDRFQFSPIKCAEWGKKEAYKLKEKGNMMNYENLKPFSPKLHLGMHTFCFYSLVGQEQIECDGPTGGEILV